MGIVPTTYYSTDISIFDLLQYIIVICKRNIFSFFFFLSTSVCPATCCKYDNTIDNAAKLI